MKKGKILKTAAFSAAAGTGIYLGVGALLCEGVLGRATLNRESDDILEIPYMFNRYGRDGIYKAADDWFTSSAREERVISGSSGDELHAEVIEAAVPSHKWAVLIHGYTSRPRAMVCQGHHYAGMGFNTVFPYLRGHRRDTHRHTSFGYFERFDIVDWINYIIALDSEAEIIIHGCSMGAGTTMLVTGQKLPSNVKCAVADCGYTTAWDEFSVQIGQILHLPQFPFLNAANAASNLFLGWDFKDCSPKYAVAHSSTPTLFIHGEEDTFVPYRMMDELFDVCSAEKDKLSVPGAAHDRSCEKAPGLYWSKTDSFIAKYL